MTLRLSARTRWDLDPTPLHEAAARQPPEYDLTASNPTRVGLVHPDEIYALLADPANRRYDPSPLGLPRAREAVAAYYERRGITVDPARVWITASTSEAYAHLLCLLCDPGDSVLVPAPGYPLLQHLAELAGVRQTSYRLHYDEGWRLDAASIAAAAPARAAIVVAPANPTGHMPTSRELASVHTRAPVCLIDEVFADYPLELDAGELAQRRRVGHAHVRLSGLSKVAGLPQMKLSWVVAMGEPLDELLARAEVVADAHLSAATPVQRALPRLLDAAETMQDRIRARLQHNLRTLDRALAGTTISRLRADAGWTALLRLPQVQDLDDERWALLLLRRAATLVQPGYLFDIAAPPRVAVSLLTPETVFERGIAAVAEAVADAVAVLP